MDNIMEKYDDGYYHFAKDLEDYPDAWCYVVWSRRGPGKTYSALWRAYYTHTRFIYMKRTIDDVELINSSTEDFDLSPFKPLNRDKNLNVYPRRIKKGIGAFYDFVDGEPEGLPVAYLLPLNGIKKIKGIDLSDCDWLLLDEFIPQAGEIIKHAEGEMILDVYMTVSRDRLARGKKPLKLILFANAEEISTPITNELEIVDLMAEMNATGQHHMYLEDRGILLHHITNDEVEIRSSEKEGIFKGMEGTAWHAKAFGGLFANNDFTNVRKVNLKNYSPFIHLEYKRKHYYIYLNEDGMYYMTSKKANNFQLSYNLDRENEQKAFYLECCIDLRNACIAEQMKFEKYSMYDLIINYKKFFEV